MTAVNTRPVVLTMSTPAGPVSVPTVGLEVACAPGLLVTPWYVGTRPVPGRFTLTHAASGLTVAAVALCAHDARRWAVAAGWIGVDWTAPAFTVAASGPARVFAWRMYDEWRQACDACGLAKSQTRTVGS